MNSCASGADGELLQPDELADAVIDVDDVIADLEVAEIGEEGAPGVCGRPARGRCTVAPHALVVEDVALGDDREAGVGEAHARGQGAGGDEDHGRARHLGGVDRQRQHVVLAQQLDRPLGAARRFGDEQRRLARLARIDGDR